jgi:hypothetical protein
MRERWTLPRCAWFNLHNPLSVITAFNPAAQFIAPYKTKTLAVIYISLTSHDHPTTRFKPAARFGLKIASKPLKRIALRRMVNERMFDTAPHF